MLIDTVQIRSPSSLCRTFNDAIPINPRFAGSFLLVTFIYHLSTEFNSSVIPKLTSFSCFGLNEFNVSPAKRSIIFWFKPADLMTFMSIMCNVGLPKQSRKLLLPRMVRSITLHVLRR